MCGIAGFVGDFDVDRLARANSAQAHRGPDAAGIWVAPAGRVGLGHRRLSIIDLSVTGSQPMEGADGAVVVVCNGEIYNYLDLRAELEATGHRFRGRSDTEVLLELYLRFGTEMLERLNGIFAFALWDDRTNTLFIARDALGVKPLYFATTPAGFAFASEIKALLQIAPEVRDLDHVALHRYLTFLWAPGDATLFRKVRKLGPGEAMCVRDGDIMRRWAWYQLPIFRGAMPDLSEAEAVTETRNRLRAAVHRQLIADVPVGAFLSGGLDSSAVVAYAREQVPGIRCFTVNAVGGQDEGVADDMPYARRVASHLGVPLEVVTIEASDMARDVAGMIAQLDEPLADPAPLNVLYIARLARQQGIKVLLSGAGGDDLFAGYRRHAALQHERYWSWLPRLARRGLARSSARFDQRGPTARRIAKMFAGAELSPVARLTNYFVWAREADLRALYTPALHESLLDSVADEPLHEFLAPLPPSTTSLDRMLALEQRFFLADHNLTYTDKMSMAAGVETRVPFLDVDLVEHAARIPAALKQRGRVGKWVLKKAMEAELPSAVIHRPKAGFGAPIRRWMRGELGPLLGDVLSRDSLARRGLFDPEAVNHLIAREARGQVDAAYTLLSLLAVEIWCRTFVDGALDYASLARS